MSQSKGLLIDITKCVGCRECERACAETNHLPQESATDLSATHLTYVKSYNDETVFVRRLCMPCRRFHKDRDRGRALRRIKMHRLPVLHAGLPLRGTAL